MKKQDEENCVKIGTMMAMEDTVADCLAAEAGANANEAEYKMTSGNSQSAGSMFRVPQCTFVFSGSGW